MVILLGERVLAVAWIGESRRTIEWLAERLGEAFPNQRVVLAGEYPMMNYFIDVARGQLISPRVVEYAVMLRGRLHVETLLLVVAADAYAPGLNFVFGEALLGGRVAVVYTLRLRPEYYGDPPDERLFHERLLKEALHELGHAWGLKHCSNPRCVMSFSNSILEVDMKEPRYCRRHAEQLMEAGVEVSPAYILPE